MNSPLATFLASARTATDAMHSTLPATVDEDWLEAEMAEAKRITVEFFERQDREAKERAERELAEAVPVI